jgi:hypothetical protein
VTKKRERERERERERGRGREEGLMTTRNSFGFSVDPGYSIYTIYFLK